MFPFFPYTNFHSLNADWILKSLEELKTTIETIASQVTTALANAVLYTSQSKTASEQRVACGNIKAVSYLTQGSSTTDRTVARANIQAVGYEAQTLTAAQQTQARTNIGAVSSSDIPDVSDVVRTSEQTLTAAQQAQARTNIDAASTSDIPDVSDVVRTSAQSLTAAQQAQARTNIGAASTSELNQTSQNLGLLISGLSNDTVHLSAQTLTEAQQTQARTNIGAAVAPLVVTFSGTSDNENAACNKTWAEISAAGTNMQIWYQNANGIKFNLNPILYATSVGGELYVVDDSGLLMYYVSVIINNEGDVSCLYAE